MKIGKQSVALNNVYIGQAGVSVGPKEFEGPLNKYFDRGYDDLYCNKDTWEQAEIELLTSSIDICLNKNKLDVSDIDCYIGGDLNNQIIAQSYTLRDYDLPFLGIFAACSTSTEGLIIGASLLEAKFGKNVLCGVSSHNATSERQFRYPTEYGGQKPDTLTFTVTGSGVALLTTSKTDLKITGLTIGKVIDAKMNDVLDLGRAMAAAAFDTIHTHFQDFSRTEKDYDLILTGDLSFFGHDMVKKLFKELKIDMTNNYSDCGLMIYDREKQEVFAGGSGTACSAVVAYSFLLEKLRDKTYKRVLLAATGALLNPVITAQKETIPGICHAVVIERSDN
jgi:stage V sporulation protein AD